MKEELRQYQDRVDLFKHEIELLKKDLHFLKLEYFESQRQKLGEKDKALGKSISNAITRMEQMYSHRQKENKNTTNIE